MRLGEKKRGGKLGDQAVVAGRQLQFPAVAQQKGVGCVALDTPFCCGHLSAIPVEYPVPEAADNAAVLEVQYQRSVVGDVEIRFVNETPSGVRKFAGGNQPGIVRQ